MELKFDENIERFKKKIDEIKIDKDVAKSLSIEKVSADKLDESLLLLSDEFSQKDLFLQAQCDITLALGLVSYFWKLKTPCFVEDLVET